MLSPKFSDVFCSSMQSTALSIYRSARHFAVEEFETGPVGGLIGVGVKLAGHAWKCTYFRTETDADFFLAEVEKISKTA